jgi:hypothetical protein
VGAGEVVGPHPHHAAAEQRVQLGEGRPRWIRKPGCAGERLLGAPGDSEPDQSEEAQQVGAGPARV